MNIILRNEEEKDYTIVEDLTREAFWNVYCPGCTEHYLVHKMRHHPDFIRELDVVEIGLVGPDGIREPIVQIPGGTSVLAHSLKWSPDGQRLMWIASVGSQDAGPVRLAEIETQLWMMDFARDEARMLAVLGRGVEVKHPAVWSPDGLGIAALFVEPRDGGKSASYGFIIDAESGARWPFTRFDDGQL